MNRYQNTADSDAAGLDRPVRRPVVSGIGIALVMLFVAIPAPAAESCDPLPDMFCVSQRVDSLFRDGKAETAHKMFVYRFHDGRFVDVAHGKSAAGQTEELACVNGRTFRSLMTFSFSADWRQGVAVFIDPGMSTVEFFNCVPDE